MGSSLEGHGRFLRELMGAEELCCVAKVGAGPDLGEDVMAALHVAVHWLCMQSSYGF